MERKITKKRVKLEEVAEAAGVSRMTVSRVLRGAAGFSEDTRNKVLREVERLGYLPNRIAATFGTDGASTLIGVCVPRLNSSLFGEALESIDRTFSRLGYQTMIGCTEHLPEQEYEWLKGLLAWQPAGVLLTGRNRSSKTISLLKNAGVPIVEFWDLNTKPFDLSVGFDHFDCGYEMGHYLLSRGHRVFGYLGASKNLKTMADNRLNGFQTALKDAGLTIEAMEIVDDKPTHYAGYYGMETLLNRAPHLKCVYFHDDTMAIGGLSYLTQNNLKVKEDIAIAGFGGMESASVLPLRLTTTIIPTEQIGKLAAEALIARIKEQPIREVTVVETRLAPGSSA